MDKFKDMMAGKEKLVITFWGWGFVGGLIFNFGLAFLAGTLGLSLLIAYALTLVYYIPVSMGIWHSSDNYKGNSLWALLAKVLVALGLVGMAFQAFTVF